MYEQIEGLIRQEKATDDVIIMGDWNVECSCWRR
jgi:exonuclease III